jgi:hypothetical protein
MVCAVDGNKVISFNSWIEWLFRWQGETYVGYQACESATDCDYRRMGIFGKVLRLGEQIAKAAGYIDFFFAFPAEIGYGAYIKAGYRHIGTYTKNIRAINPMLIAINPRGRQELESESATEFQSQQTKVTPLVDFEYMKWRYHQNPWDYRIIHYKDNENMATFVLRPGRYVTRLFGIGFPVFQIVDCRFTSYDKEFMDSAFKYVDRLHTRKAVWFSTIFNEGTDRGQELRHHFHVRVKERGPKFIFKKIRPTIDENVFHKFENWDLAPHVVDVS